MTRSLHRSALAIIVATLVSAHTIAHADTGDAIGTAAAITTDVTGKTATQTALVKTGDGVVQNEALTSNGSGIGACRNVPAFTM